MGVGVLVLRLLLLLRERTPKGGGPRRGEGVEGAMVKKLTGLEMEIKLLENLAAQRIKKNPEISHYLNQVIKILTSERFGGKLEYQWTKEDKREWDRKVTGFTLRLYMKGCNMTREEALELLGKSGVLFSHGQEKKCCGQSKIIPG